ncbi:hypothetical protein GCM10022276_23060 [Sphingomonas limnosediminicola]|uniref:Uncharacterized protein n=1 Tax=Sphingomonas limnosediminicola TaxID=940133 RepID=A0ABP7LMC9_9SPHN
MFRLYGDDEVQRLCRDHPMRGISELNQHVMRSFTQADEHDCSAACIDEMPRGVVHGHMEVTYPRGYAQRACSEDRQHPKVLGPVLDEDPPLGEGLGEGRVDDEPGSRLVVKSD